MKTCNVCHRELPRGAFHKNKNRADGLQSYCRDCASARSTAYHKRSAGRAPVRSANRERSREAARNFVNSHLVTHPCVDCGEGDIIVLEFDHVRGDKRFSVAQAVRMGYGLDTIAAELAKCEVRCANCHRRVTAVRGGFARTSWQPSTPEA